MMSDVTRVVRVLALARNRWFRAGWIATNDRSGPENEPHSDRSSD